MVYTNVTDSNITLTAAVSVVATYFCCYDSIDVDGSIHHSQHNSFCLSNWWGNMHWAEKKQIPTVINFGGFTQKEKPTIAHN